MTTVTLPKQPAPFQEYAIELSKIAPVLPLAPMTKIPMKGSGGYRDATTDTIVIERWRRQYPTSNIGWCAGSGLLCLDVDRRHGGDRMLRSMVGEVGPLPGTLSVRTPGGFHYWFQGDVATSHFTGGIDLLGAGSYAVAPYSVRRAGCYELLSGLVLPVEFPAEHLDWLCAHRRRQRRPPSGRAGSPRISEVPAPKMAGDRRPISKRADGLLKRRKAAADSFDRDSDVAAVILNMARSCWSFAEVVGAFSDRDNGLSDKIWGRGTEAGNRELVRTWNWAISEVHRVDQILGQASAIVESLPIDGRAGSSCRTVLRWAINEAAAHPVRRKILISNSGISFEVPATCRTVAAATGLHRNTVFSATKSLRSIGVLEVVLSEGRTMKTPSRWRIKLPVAQLVTLTTRMCVGEGSNADGR